ncbi:hypothetical protein Patl1_14759 [Pistacia atlantica]|uniref:Uncharacterized protein n=1 Tax=Pistacia atlantica TaxID=434234 RepID=A0ACC1ASM2_9ROSI|nr:hypothetical protein Patl1_14759 [Pistacia atlantica]
MILHRKQASSSQPRHRDRERERKRSERVVLVLFCWEAKNGNVAVGDENGDACGSCFLALYVWVIFGKKDDLKKQLDVKYDENEKATWDYYLQCWLEDEGVDLKQLGLNQQDQNLKQRLLVLKWQVPLQWNMNGLNYGVDRLVMAN